MGSTYSDFILGEKKEKTLYWEFSAVLEQIIQKLVGSQPWGISGFGESK